MLKVSARVAAKIQNQFCHPVGLHVAQSREELIICVCREAIDAHIPDAFLEHERGVHAVERNLVAKNGDINGCGNTGTDDTNNDLCAFLAAKSLLNIFILEFHSGFTVDNDDFIA